MNRIIYTLALFFSFFPYLQIIPLETYTQPYYVVFGAIAFVVISRSFIRHFPKKHAYSLMFFAGIGFLGFLITIAQSVSSQEIKALLQYISPLFLAALSYFLVIKNSERFRRQTLVAIMLWLGVAAIQMFVYPTFAVSLTGSWGVESAEVVVNSGRGVLSLAPEPTHFALHVFALLTLATVLGESKFRLVAGLVLLFLFSSSTTLALVVAFAILINIIQFKMLNKQGLIFLALLISVLVLGFFVVDQNSRLYYLVSMIVSNPIAVFEFDGSANARASGLALGSQAILENWFFPHGLSNTDWLEAAKKLTEGSVFFGTLSSSGVASGYLRPIYEVGFLAFPFFVLFLRAMWLFPKNHIDRLMIVGFIGIFFMQFLISSPVFGLVYGATLARLQVRGGGK